MKDFGQYLWAKFLETNWDLIPGEPMEYADAQGILELFFENSDPIRQLAEDGNHVWTEKAVIELDQKLMQFAESGETELKMLLSPEGAEELWRRWEYAIIGATLEAKAGNAFSVPWPRGAPAIIAGTAVMLSILGGPSHDYPRNVFSKPPARP